VFVCVTVSVSVCECLCLCVCDCVSVSVSDSMVQPQMDRDRFRNVSNSDLVEPNQIRDSIYTCIAICKLFDIEMLHTSTYCLTT